VVALVAFISGRLSGMIPPRVLEGAPFGTPPVTRATAFKRAVTCNVLEDESNALQMSGDEIVIPYSPFQIVSLKLT
jgi:hypothetical protein